MLARYVHDISSLHAHNPLNVDLLWPLGNVCCFHEARRPTGPVNHLRKSFMIGSFKAAGISAHLVGSGLRRFTFLFGVLHDGTGHLEQYKAWSNNYHRADKSCNNRWAQTFPDHWPSGQSQ